MVKIKMMIIVMVAKIRHIYYKHNTMHVKKHIKKHVKKHVIDCSDTQSPKQCQYKLKTAAQ